MTHLRALSRMRNAPKLDEASFVRLNGSALPGQPIGATLRDYFHVLSNSLGPMHWWPAKTPFEVIVGAILTQSTAWVNVKLALANLRRERLLTPAALERVPMARLARLIR